MAWKWLRLNEICHVCGQLHSFCTLHYLPLPTTNTLHRMGLMPSATYVVTLLLQYIIYCGIDPCFWHSLLSMIKTHLRFTNPLPSKVRLLSILNDLVPLTNECVPWNWQSFLHHYNVRSGVHHITKEIDLLWVSPCHMRQFPFSEWNGVPDRGNLPVFPL